MLVLHNTKYIIFNNSLSAERDYECQILLCWILLVFRLVYMILFLRAHNLVHAKISVRASCAHDRHRTRNLSSPVIEIFTTALLLTTAYCRALSLKNTIHLKFAWHSKRQKENIEKKRKTKNEKSQTATIIVFTFTFFYWKIYILYILLVNIFEML